MTTQRAIQLPLLDTDFLDVRPGFQAAVAKLASGSIEVVDFILDLVGFTTDKPLYRSKILEPCFGNGDFLIPVIERLVASFGPPQSQHQTGGFEALKGALRAVEVHTNTFSGTCAKVRHTLSEAGFNPNEQDTLVKAWLINGDFLLEPLGSGFDFVVGNPPYVRQELIPDMLLQEYRKRFSTIFDRADIYIPFIERSLTFLASGGALGFICADRWMKNRYGGPLRKMIAEGYRLKFYVDMVDTAAFHSEVATYPAITVITREEGSSTRLAHRPQIDSQGLSSLVRTMQSETMEDGSGVKKMSDIVQGGSPWILESSAEIEIVRRLEREFPALEDAGCQVGIGVATGADKVFIAPFETLDVEEDRKLPLVMTRDIDSGSVKWRGFGVINPFSDQGGLVDLAEFPKLARYLDTHGDAIKARHVSKRNPTDWYRTIDRITPSLARRPKLLIPDIKGEAHIVFESGKLYPHHNLYFIVSDEWDLKALRALLMSGIARLFVSTYSTKMRGGYLRFQAQYLRRIRIPAWRDVDLPLRTELVAAAEKGDLNACNAAAFKVYGFSKAERSALGEDGE